MFYKSILCYLGLPWKGKNLKFSLLRFFMKRRRSVQPKEQKRLVKKMSYVGRSEIALSNFYKTNDFWSFLDNYYLKLSALWLVALLSVAVSIMAVTVSKQNKMLRQEQQLKLLQEPKT